MGAFESPNKIQTGHEIYYNILRYYLSDFGEDCTNYEASSLPVPLPPPQNKYLPQCPIVGPHQNIGQNYILCIFIFVLLDGIKEKIKEIWTEV